MRSGREGSDHPGTWAPPTTTRKDFGSCSESDEMYDMWVERALQQAHTQPCLIPRYSPLLPRTGSPTSHRTLASSGHMQEPEVNRAPGLGEAGQGSGGPQWGGAPPSPQGPFCWWLSILPLTISSPLFLPAPPFAPPNNPNRPSPSAPLPPCLLPEH